LGEVAEHGFVLTAGRYVGVPDGIHDGEPFDSSMARLASRLSEQLDESERLASAIRTVLASLRP
jgi:type I restriction enzyme M protein